MRAGVVVWLEFDPQSAAHQLWTLRHHRPHRITPPQFSVASKVNGYGGGALCLMGTQVYVVNEATQQIECVDTLTGARAELTREPGSRFGGLAADEHHRRVLAVQEVTRDDAIRQQLVAIDCVTGDVTVLTWGEDFFGAPTVASEGHEIAWVSWQLPDMPWVKSRLWTATVDRSGALGPIRDWPTPEAGSVQQPLFVGAQLTALSDHGGWWQPYRIERSVAVSATAGQWVALAGRQADHANAPWQLAEHHAAVMDDGWVRVHYDQGFGQLWWSDALHRQSRLAEDYSDFRSLQADNGWVYCIGRSQTHLDSVLQIAPASGDVRVLAGGEQPLAASVCVSAQTFEFEAADGQPVSGLFYPPQAPACPSLGESSPKPAPPVILLVHGGPTSAAYPVFDSQVQFWVQQGFAVAAVNYRGSSGFGRAFRHSLAGRWGEADVADIRDAVGHLAGLGWVDAATAFIQGRSAGGFTALLALVRSTVFLAGASLFGVSDPARLRARTHRFESGYLDWLLGAPDAHHQRWLDRTPALLADHIHRPVIFFQGGQDAVVVPEQTAVMVAALESRGLAPQYHYFEEEGHGFRNARRQTFMLEQLLAFYQDQRKNSSGQTAGLE